MIGVLHGDDAAYYALAIAHRESLAACVAVSRRIAANVDQLVSSDNTAAIPCGIVLRPLASPSERRQAKLIWVGRMEEEFKRVSDLALIAEAVRARGIDFTLDIVGDGSGEPLLRRLLAERGLEPRVRLLGWRDADELYELMSASDVMLLPSNREGMPVVMMEALAAGCAVVASRVSGVEDASAMSLSDGVLFTHDVGAVHQAALLVESALSRDDSLRRRSARLFAEKTFSIAACVDQYQAIVNRSRPVPSRGSRTTPGRAVIGAISLPVALARAARRAFGVR
jgi:glycosyltransferase involved in cell wall biosynthesis